MKITVVHSVYLKNPFIAETLVRNIIALFESGIDYQYIVFNDNGNPEIEKDIKDFIDTLEISEELMQHFNNIEYIYSDINYGKKMCAGSYIGAIPYVKGDVIHLIGQDDVFTSVFYQKASDAFISNKDIYFVTFNGYRTDENLNITAIMINPQYYMDCSKPLELFKTWFGIYPPLYEVTQANNGFLAPGTLYKKELHDLIGLVDLENFKGAADFEYWARILYNDYKGIYFSEPSWYYRISEYTAGNAVIDGKPNRGYWQQVHIQAIKEKYTTLVQQNKEKFK
jgi:hypothetical protein